MREELGYMENRKSEQAMSCLEAQQQISRFLQKQLSDEQLELFLDHVEYCPECMEELEIHHLIYRALNEETDQSAALAEGKEALNYRQMLEDQIKAARDHLFTEHVIMLFRRIVILLAQLALVLTLAKEFGLFERLQLWQNTHTAMPHVQNVQSLGGGEGGSLPSETELTMQTEEALPLETELTTQTDEALILETEAQ